jgi:hypothetical protein
MRKHVFPVCKPSFNVLDFDTIDETQSYPISGSFDSHGGVSSTGVKYNVVFNTTNSLILYSSFLIEDGGEYLVNDDISAPSETTLDWTGDANGIQINALSVDSIKNITTNNYLSRLIEFAKPTKGLAKGEVVCIGSKPPLDSAFRRNNLPAPWLYNPNIPYLYNMPLSDTEFSFGIDQESPYDSTGIAWITLMWSGTRWVYLGSSTWL